MKNSKLDAIATLSIQSLNLFAKVEDVSPFGGRPIGPHGERTINEILDNLKEMKNLIPLVESDLKALSSL